MLRTVLALMIAACGAGAAALPWAATRPKLTVVIVIDQFRADTISRFQSSFGKDGFNALIQNGAYFPYGEYDVLQAMTGPGHATILTGAYPYQMGIPLNDWYDAKTGAVVYCVEDRGVNITGGKAAKASVSPRNLIGTTVGDELKNADFPARNVSIALKDRAAILMGGHRADLALWFDNDSQRWVTSTYYRKEPVAWIETLNKSLGKCEIDGICGTDMTVAAVKAALAGEKLGLGIGNESDMLSISFSSHDFVGHEFGPNSEEIRAITIAEDKAIGEIRKAIALRVPGGLKNVVFVLTGDHGVAPKPEYLEKVGIDTGRVNKTELFKELNEALNAKFGPPKARFWITHIIDFNFFLDTQNLREAKIEPDRMQAALKALLLKNPSAAQVFTRAEVDAHLLPPGMFARKVERTYFRGRSGDVVLIPKPFYIDGSKGEANHMTGYTYDRTVPIVFSGFGIKNGLFPEAVEVVDIAPTLSFLLGILPPALNEGHVLAKALK